MLTLPHTFHMLPAVEASSSGAAVVTEPRRRESALRRRFASVSSVVPRRRESALRRRFGSAVVSVPRRRESALRRRLASTVVLTLSSVVLTSSVSLLAIVIASQNGARLRMIIRVMNPMVCDLEEGGCGEHGVESLKTLSQCCPGDATSTAPTGSGTRMLVRYGIFIPSQAQRKQQPKRKHAWRHHGLGRCMSSLHAML